MQVPADRVSWDPKSTVAFWINQISRRILRLHDARLKAFGFGMSQVPVLLALEESGPLSQKALAERSRVEQPTMAEMLGRMERDGVIERTPNPEDRRGSLVSLTRRSRARIPKAKDALMQGERDATAGFSAAEKAILMELLLRVARNLDEATE